MHIQCRAAPVQANCMKDWALTYVRHVLEVKGWTAADLARRVGVAHSTINRPLTAPDWKGNLSRKTLAEVVRVSGIDPAPFMPKGEIIAAPTLSAPPDEPPTLVPVYAVHASAGHGALVADHEEVIDRLAFPPGYLRTITRADPRNLAIIGVKGDSMAPTLADNDVVMVDISKRDLSFDGLFVLRDGGASLLVKRIGRGSGRGRVLVISDNRTYPPMERPIEEIEVVGKVVWRGVRE